MGGRTDWLTCHRYYLRLRAAREGFLFIIVFFKQVKISKKGISDYV